MAELLVIAAALDVPPALLVFAVGSVQETEMLPGCGPGLVGDGQRT